MLKNTLIFILASFVAACNSKKTKADLIIIDATIYTVDASFSKATAMAVKDGKILETNSNENILAKYNATETLNLNGKTIVPGFIDAHCHFTGYATDLWKCNLVGSNSYDDVLSRMKTYAKSAPMLWLYGRGWDQNDWEDKTYPCNKELNELFPNRPVFIKRIDGHAAIANDVALALAGITANTKVNGGKVVLLNGKPSGLLIDQAMTLVDKVVPQIPDTMALRYFKQTEQICLSLGLTGVHDCGIGDHTVDLLRRMDSLQQLQIKVFAMLSDDSVHYAKWLKQGPLKMPHVHVGGFKVYADGALGSRGACLLEPYSDDKQWHGFLLSDTTHFKNLATRLAQTPFQMCTHAIGDSANRFMLQTYARVLKGKNNKRWRIEHAQVVNDADFHWFGDFNIIPSVQPTHATSDMYWAAMRLGEKRMAGAYAYKRLLDQNHMIPLGTDFPVEDISPVKTFYAAVFRKDKNNYPATGFQTENALSREEALRGMSIWAAYAAFEENEKGSLEKNKAADFLVLNTDILRCAEKDVLQTKVLATYVNGKLVFSNN